MPVHFRKDCFLWKHFLNDPTGTVIVLPSPHGPYKRGISYSDACTMGEIYARLQNIPNLDVRTPELLGSDIRKNLILLAGPKANPVTRELYTTKEMCLTFELEDGLIFDREQHLIVTPRYVQGATHTVENLTLDYGLICYMDNPFGPNTKVLHLAGIRGCGTLAAALTVTEKKSLDLIEQRLATSGVAQSKHAVIEILVNVGAHHGRVKRETLGIEKLAVHHRRSRWSLASENYQQLKPVIPHRLSVTVSKKADSDLSPMTIKIDDQRLRCAKSPDRRNLLYCLAKHARKNYCAGSENPEWKMAGELAKELWHIESETGYSELSPELRRTLADSIMTWVRHLAKKGQLKLDSTIPLDHHYINSEILVFDHDMRKRLTDLVYAINHEAKAELESDFQLIVSQHGRGYRLNIHPALISITHLESE